MAHSRGGGRGPAAHAPAAPMPAPAFPKLPLDEILEDLRLFEQPMARDDLRKPTPDGVRRIFMFFIAKVYGTTDDDLRQPAFGCLDALVNPELHDDAVPQLHFLRACQRLFKSARYNGGFGIRDLMDPQPARLMWQMSALINYAKFREKRVRELMEMTEAGDEIRALMEASEEKLARVDAQIAELERRREAEAPRVGEEQAAVDELTAELSQLHQRHVVLTEETKQSKAKLQGAVEGISTLKFRLMAVRQERELLQSRVVSSPDRVRGEIREMEASIEAGKARLLDVRAKTRAAVDRGDRLATAAGEVEAACKMVDEAAAEVERATAMEARVKEQNAKIRDCEDEREALVSSCAHLERQIASLQGRRDRVRQQRADLGEKERSAAARLAEQSREVDREVDAAKEAIAENNRRASEIARTMQRLVTDFEDEVAVIARKVTLVDKRLAAHCKEVDEMNGLVGADNRKALADLRNVIQNTAPPPA